MPFSPPAVRCRDVIVEQMITPSGPAQKTICCGAHAAGIPRLTQHRANLSNPAKVMFGPYDYIFLAGCFAGRRTRNSRVDKVEPMMTRFAVATAAVLLGCGSAYAQAPLSTSPLPPLGLTSPLGIPNAPVGQTGIPLGATELATPGVSPTTSGASPLLGATCGGVSSAPASAAMGSPMTGASAGMGSSVTGASAGTASSMTGLSSSTLFDGGGMSATAPTTCAASATASTPLASSMGPGSTVGPAGIPLGSTELGGGGLSPPSVALSPNPSVPVTSSLTPLSGMTPSNPSVSAAPSTPTCATTQTGVPTIAGVPTTFGAPLTGLALSLEATRCP